jgi:organic radical activating enzyme
MKLLAKYNNGNYKVKLYDNGTKVRFTKDDEFISEFPENIDIKITDKCDAGCPFCHEDSTLVGKHGKIINVPFLKTLHRGTELAIGGGNPLEHPNLISFLFDMKAQGVVCNLTINEKHFFKNKDMLSNLIADKLIHGLGISVNRYNYDHSIIDFARENPNTVFHIINGILPYEDIEIMFNQDIKILILGYKMFRRGEQNYSDSVKNIQEDIYNNLEKIMNSFNTISFDNLAIKQLKPQRFMTQDEWNEFYMGDDGKFTMYIDMVKQKFAMNSTSETRYDLLPTIDEMFKVVKEKADEYSRDIC